MRVLRLLSVLALLGAALSLAGCPRDGGGKTRSSATSNRVVLYCSVDDVYARPIIRELEKKTGLRIQAVYDTEAAKTAGLANRIRAEKDRPVGDVFWSSALLQTLLLDREGLLQRYASPAAKDIPTAFREISGTWSGLGVRTRDIIYQPATQNPPRSLDDLLSPRFKGKAGISNPQFGTGSDWVAALAARRGVSKTLDYFRALKQNGVQVLPGNSVVAERVARGELMAGVTDTDDMLAQIREGRKLGRATVARSDEPTNVILIPGTVAMIKGSPHPEAAQRLIDALLSTETEQLLVKTMPGVLPLRGPLPDDKKAAVATTDPRFGAPDDTSAWVDAWNSVREPLAAILLSD